MPSLWDLLCVSRQHKYTTDAKPTRHPRDRWDDPPRYDPSNVEYYIRPNIAYHRGIDPAPSHSSAPYGNSPPPRSPSSRRNFRVRESPGVDPQPSRAWYREVRGPQSLSSSRDFLLREGDVPPLFTNRQDSKVVPAHPEGGHHLYSDHQSLMDSIHDTASTGKRRHVRDIFADMPSQYHDNGARPLDSSTMPVASSSGYHSDRLGRHHWETSGSEPKQSLRSMPISGSRQTSGYTQSTDSRQTSQFSPPAQPRQTSRYAQPAQSRQVSGYSPATGTGQSSGLMPITGSRSRSKYKPPESMHQYSPRTVSDSAVSAALLGSRIDDFVHDPGWNRAINKFAPSPTSTSAFSFEDRSFPRPADRSVSSQRTISPKDSDGNVTFVVATQPDSFGTNQPNKEVSTLDSRVASQSSKTASSVYTDAPESSPVQASGPRHTDRKGDVSHMDRTPVPDQERGFPQTGAGSGQDFQGFFTPDEDVLY